ncbi:MAG: DUF2064 domain-containing protein [Candidatus Heimdallarchaeota archaeon]|nr:DUF2064 domain-containing protein [Candidatus Heimdallarchaeota archaeon]
MKSAVLVFAKVPRIGFVKTRLVEGAISDFDAYLLSKSFIIDVLNQVQNSNVDCIFFSLGDDQFIDSNDLGKILDIDISKYTKLSSIFHKQSDGTFGERMEDAIKSIYQQFEGKLIILGMDSPHIQPNRINKALNQLEDFDLVVGPGLAGGIYLIGFSRLLLLDEFHLCFEGVELLKFTKWTKKHNYSCWLLPELSDIDTPDDLIGLIAWIETAKIIGQSNKIQLPNNTIKLISQLKLEIITPDNNRDKKIIKGK